MNKSQRFWRAFFIIFFITALCGGMALPVTGGIPVYAAPRLRVSPKIVISEFRTRGPGSGSGDANDEFVELYNAGTATVDISGWTIRKSTGCGAASSTPLETIPASTSIDPGQYYLATGLSYAGATAPDYRDTSDWSIADDGGIALLNGTTVIDQVGMCATTAYLEGNPLAPMSGTSNQSYERRAGGSAGNCNDTDNNAADFVLNSGTSNPQNRASPPLACLGVTNVSSTDGTYIAGQVVNISITFSAPVDVTGAPRLRLETGSTDEFATYMPAASTPTALVFSYTVMPGDTSPHLDYVSTNSLELNGGSIIGPIGNAVLTLPSPGAPGSLGANNNIIINNNVPPTVVSFRRQNPGSTPTNADTLVFRATFSEAVINVDPTDFIVTPGGTTGTPTTVTPISNSVYDVTVSGGDLATFNGPVGLDLNAPPTLNITDTTGTEPLVLAEPTPATNDEIYTLDNTPLTVAISVPLSQANPTGALPVNFTVTFSKSIVPTSFTVSDITQFGPGTASSVTWNIAPTSNPAVFNLSAPSLASNGNLTPSIAAGLVIDAAGNGNTPSTNSTVIFSDTTPPTVTVNQASGQVDPTTILPIRFTIVFSEPIDTRVFAPADILQNGTASGVTWSITDTGNHTTFNLAATAVTGYGTLIPSIPANRVTDLVGNSNAASTSTDNAVTLNSGISPSVVISQFRALGPNGANDEFVELYNPTSNMIDISGWKIYASNDTGSTSIRATIPSLTVLRAGQYYLIANNGSGGYSGSITANLTYTSGITEQGGIALYRSNNTIVDRVGLSAGSAYKEGTPLAPLTGTSNQSYERRLGGTSGSCQDTDNNANDFIRISPSNPHNYSSPVNLCGVTRTVNQTAISITAHTPDPSLTYGYVDVSVSVTGTSLSPAGTLVYITGANTNCTITLNASGTGSCNARFTSTGTKTITATYLGDNTHYGSSTSVSHSVVIYTPTKYRTRTPTPLPPPKLLGINEFLPRPGHDWNNDGAINTGDEYIELINFGVVDVPLSGYSLDDEANIGSSPYRLPSTITLKPGERMVFYGSQTGIHLDDGGDGVRLLKPNGQLADAYNYSVVRFPDESFCRLPDNGGLDDWNQFCFPTPGLPNSASQSSVNPPTTGNAEELCPIADTLPDDFTFAECQPFGKNIWNPDYWDRNGWFDEKDLPGGPGKWSLFGD